MVYCSRPWAWQQKCTAALHVVIHTLYTGMTCHFTAGSRFAPSLWETALLCKDVSHWLGASLESAMRVWAPIVRTWATTLHICRVFSCNMFLYIRMLYHLCQHWMAAIWKTIFSSLFSCTIIVVFWFELRCNKFLRAHITIGHLHRRQTIILTNVALVCCRKNASVHPGELIISFR